MTSPMTRARSILEGEGVPVTVSLLEVAATAVETYTRRRDADSQIGDTQLVKEIAQNIIKNVGQYQAVTIVSDNNRLSAWRKPASPERPTHPSVEDLCLEVVETMIQRILTEYIEREKVS